MSRKWVILAVMVLVIGLLAACGGGQDEGIPGQARNDGYNETRDDGYEDVRDDGYDDARNYGEYAAEPEEVDFDEAEADEISASDVNEIVDPWAYVDFDNIRQPLHLAYYVPHGYIAVNHIEFINDNLYGRSPFTYREKEAAAWLVEELLAMGYNWDDIYVQEFYQGDVTQWFGHTWDTPIGRWILGDGVTRYYSQNVILTVPGRSERKIIVGAHYDSLPYPGASDNASGVGLLLESAQRMLNEDNYHTIVYIFFGAEEVGLIGAHVYVNSLSFRERERIAFMINADVLFEGPYKLYGTARYVGGRRLTNDITRQVDEIARGVYAAHGVEIIDIPGLVYVGSDHLPFKWAGHTVVVLCGLYRSPYGRGFIGDFMLQVWHSPRDDFHYINENWPGKIDRNMRYFSIFLEEMLLAQF